MKDLETYIQEDSQKVYEGMLNDIKIAQERHLTMEQAIEEGLFKGLLGSLTGLTVGPAIGKAVCKALGISSGPLYNLLTSRAVLTVVGGELGFSM